MQISDEQKQLREEWETRNPLPSTELLFHYTSRTSPDDLLKTIGGGLFYFSNPLHFNDALDMKIPITTHSQTPENDYFPINATQHTETGFYTGPVNVYEHDPQLAEYLPKLLGYIVEENLSFLRTICLTNRDDHNLMWSHYGNRHAGIAFGFNWNKISLLPHKVHYKDSISLNDLGQPRVEVEAHPRLRTKTSDWSYESEWRYFLSARTPDETVFVPLGKALDSITLGTKIPNDVRCSVIEHITRYRPSIKIFQIEIIEGQLISVPVELLENFNSFKPNQLRELIDPTILEVLKTGDFENFITQNGKYFYHIPADDDIWHPIVAASQFLSDDSPNKKTIQRWCPTHLFSRTTVITRSGNLGNLPAPDEMDIWHAYFACMSRNSLAKTSLIESIENLDNKIALNAEQRRLFFRLGWRIANFILKDNSQHPKYDLLPKICQTNLNMANKLGVLENINQCQQLLNSLTE